MLFKKRKRKFNAFIITKGFVKGFISVTACFLIFTVLIINTTEKLPSVLLSVYFNESVIIPRKKESVLNFFIHSSAREVIEEPEKEIIPELPKTEEKDYSSNVKIKNLTNKQINVNSILSSELTYKSEADLPMILILHTHTTESYYEQDRSTDEEKNMLAVGGVLADNLNQNGIKTIQNRTVHDYPSYSGAYSRSAETAKSSLANNPSVKIIFDVHRDAAESQDGSKIKPTYELNGKKYAQIMFVVGTDSQLENPHWEDNLKLALKLQEKSNELYPGLMRPINLREQRFNQQIGQNNIIIEVGANGNTIEEAKNSMELLSEVIAKTLI